MQKEQRQTDTKEGFVYIPCKMNAHTLFAPLHIKFENSILSISIPKNLSEDDHKKSVKILEQISENLVFSNIPFEAQHDTIKDICKIRLLF